jgi:hypothetical protein
MEFKKGEQALWKTFYDNRYYPAEVSSVSDESVVLKPEEKPSEAPSPGQDVVVRTTSGECFAQVLEVTSQEMSLKPLSEESREYFRVDDVFPVLVRRIGEGQTRRARVVPGHGVELFEVNIPDDAPDAGIWKLLGGINARLGLLVYGLELSGGGVPDEKTNPDVWGMLKSVEAKLEMVLEELDIKRGEILRAANREVNVSASGIRFRISDELTVGETIEVKMLLPSKPPVGVLTAGKVVRADEVEEGYEVALDFSEMEDEVRDEIIRYALGRQREIIWQKRRQGK